MFLLFFVAAFLVTGVLAECPLGWQHFENKCYYFSTTRLSWHSAASSCRVHGAELANIQTKAENDYLKYFASRFGQSIQGMT